MYDRNVVFFGKGRDAAKIACSSREQAELLVRLVNLGLRLSLNLPTSEQACRAYLARLEDRLVQARAQFEVLAESRGGNEKARDEVVGLLLHWFVHGRARTSSDAVRDARVEALP